MSDDLAAALMLEFAESTGLSSAAAPRRYLWTDAFAVCNFLGLYRQAGSRDFLELAVKLVDQVHHSLGRHRNDDSRRGWISGLPDSEGELHPTRGGLRIGKELNERSREEPLDERLEWDRDGQYFHYLTKWMHALNRLGLETGESRYQQWADELASTALRAFILDSYPGGPRRMVWKMSIDLRRPLVPSMGQHDPLDGLVTCLELKATRGTETPSGVDLEAAITGLTDICERCNWATDDMLGVGGLLDDASRLVQLVFERGGPRRGLLRRILLDAELSLIAIAGGTSLSEPAQRRLAFRELGLAIGIHGLERVQDLVTSDRELSAMISSLLTHRELAGQIEHFWSDPAHRQCRTWISHRDINAVMLATSLAPEGYLQL